VSIFKLSIGIIGWESAVGGREISSREEMV
jgi:hypothetical protein